MQGSARVWGPLDDVVMGGVSESGFELRQQGGESGGPVGVFSGIVSAANSGGFASVRPVVKGREVVASGFAMDNVMHLPLSSANQCSDIFLYQTHTACVHVLQQDLAAVFVTCCRCNIRLSFGCSQH